MIEQKLARVLAWGVALSACLFALGLLLVLAAGWASVGAPDWLRTAGSQVLGLGVVCLLATPLLRIASALALFLREGDRTYVAIEFAVLVIVLSSAVLEWATRHGAH